MYAHTHKHTHSLCDAGVDSLLVVHLNGRDLALLGQERAGRTGERGVDLEALDEGRGRDELHLGHLCLQAVPAVLVEEHLRVQLLAELALVPLLLTVRERETDRERESVCVCVCMCVSIVSNL